MALLSHTYYTESFGGHKWFVILFIAQFLHFVNAPKQQKLWEEVFAKLLFK